jgi:hypothetical protein
MNVHLIHVFKNLKLILKNLIVTKLFLMSNNLVFQFIMKLAQPPLNLLFEQFQERLKYLLLSVQI